MSVTEKRHFIRHPFHLPIRVRRTHRAGHPAEVRTDNVSEGGLAFVWMRRLKPGSELIIRIPVKAKIFELTARVVYARKIPRRQAYLTGVCFGDAGTAFRAKLAEETLEIIDYQRRISVRLGREVSEEEAAAEWVLRYAASFTTAVRPPRV
ncbi:MAG: hypothetical protein MOGMAGMI_02149 [Candidatus Omnitrophica bacterium]|nr:hypothetical protein [Candidatus Omnitrophota bacterium]